MLVIRQAQMEVLAKARAERFTVEQVERIRERHPEKFAPLGEKGMHQLITSTIQQGESWGIDIMGDLEDLIEIVLVCGKDFWNDPDAPWIREVLESTELSGFAKTRLLALPLGVDLEA
jgi:hypothetical protein